MTCAPNNCRVEREFRRWTIAVFDREAGSEAPWSRELRVCRGCAEFIADRRESRVGHRFCHVVVTIESEVSA